MDEFHCPTWGCLRPLLPARHLCWWWSSWRQKNPLVALKYNWSLRIMWSRPRKSSTLCNSGHGSWISLSTQAQKTSWTSCPDTQNGWLAAAVYLRPRCGAAAVGRRGASGWGIWRRGRCARPGSECSLPHWAGGPHPDDLSSKRRRRKKEEQ